MASSERLDATYDSASARNGTACPTPNSAPPTGGPPRRTTDWRGSSAPAAGGSSTAGTTPRRASGPGGAEDDGATALHEGHREDRPQARVAEEEQDREAGDRAAAHGVSGDHQPPAAPAVGRHAGRQAEDPVRSEPREADQTGLGGRLR